MNKHKTYEETMDKNEAEKKLLGYLIWNPDFISAISKQIKPSNFVYLRNRVIYNKLIKLNKKNVKFNYLSLSNYFKPWQSWAPIYLEEIANCDDFSDNPEIYKYFFINDVVV